MSAKQNPLSNETTTKTGQAETPEIRTKTGAVHDMNDLAAALNNIANRYDTPINKLQQAYNQKQIQYKNAYSQFQDSVKYKVSDNELEKQRKKLHPYEDQLRSTGQEWNKMKKQKQTEALQILQQMQDKQGEYVNEQAAVLRNKLRQIQNLKKQYTEVLQEIGSIYTNTAQIDNLMKTYHKKYKQPYKNTAAYELNTRINNVSRTDFEINADDVKKALKKEETKPYD